VSAFFDTNILIYAQQAGAKGNEARAVLAKGGKISVQVLNEFTSVSSRKQGKDWNAIAEAIEDVLAVVDPPLPLTLDLHHSARELAAVHRLSFYEALIIATALAAGCDLLYSEDLEHSRVFGGLKIINPFAGNAR
jgi:predicted nucleic acid-binding protein